MRHAKRLVVASAAVGFVAVVFLLLAYITISVDAAVGLESHDMLLLTPDSVQRVSSAAEGGDLKAQAVLGVANLRGDRLQRNVTESLYWFEQIADRDRKEFEHLENRIRSVLKQRRQTNDGEEIHRLEVEYLDLILQRSAYELSFIGLIGIYTGSHGPSYTNATRAVQYMIQGSEYGFPCAQRTLGVARVFGLLGLPQSRTHGVRLLHDAAAQGDHQAEYILGHLYSSGAGGVRDLDYAKYWFRRAALHNPRTQALTRLES